MFELARRLIRHQPLRYLAALFGVSAAAGLAFIQLGLYFGFKQSASVVVDNVRGDVWVCGQYVENFDFPQPVDDRLLELVGGTPGVAWAEPLIVVFCAWKLADGGTESVEVIGYNPKSGVGRPWRTCAGFTEDLARPGAVSVDVTTAAKLDNATLGYKTEINGVAAKVAVLTAGCRSFQGHPMIFTSLNNARSFGRSRIGRDQIHYVVAGLEADADLDAVLRRLNQLPYMHAYSKAEFSRRAQDYWLTKTSAGVILALTALMGLAVGVVVAGQVLYTATLEHIREYGTLKAMGATNRQVGGAVVAQAILGALPAHLLAGGLLWTARHFISGKGIHIAVDLKTFLWLGIFTVLVCVAASLLSVWRILRLDPADVFRGG